MADWRQKITQVLRYWVSRSLVNEERSREKVSKGEPKLVERNRACMSIVLLQCSINTRTACSCSDTTYSYLIGKQPEHKVNGQPPSVLRIVRDEEQSVKLDVSHLFVKIYKLK